MKRITCIFLLLLLLLYPSNNAFCEETTEIKNIDDLNLGSVSFYDSDEIYYQSPTDEIDLPLQNSDQLKSTIITPFLDTKIEKDKNYIFCSTFQMAWNEACKMLDEPIAINSIQSFVHKLNILINQPNLLTDDSYIAMAGFKKDNIIEKINQALKNKFKNPPVVNAKLSNDYDILAYSYLNKKLLFKHKFENIKDGLLFSFGTIEVIVSAFGINNYSSLKHENSAKQIELLYWNDEIDNLPKGCIVNLKTLSQNDELIISSLPIEDTLIKTYGKIKDFINHKYENYLTPDQLISLTKIKCSHSQNDSIIFSSFIVPKINFDILHSYDILKNKILDNRKLLIKLNLIDQFYFISEAIQYIKFKLNEDGAKLESYAKIVLSIGKGFIIKTPLSINGPFIVYLKNKNSDYPYFMTYIGNNELLINKEVK